MQSSSSHANNKYTVFVFVQAAGLICDNMSIKYVPVLVRRVIRLRKWKSYEYSYNQIASRL
eukprot:scaffold184090_cov19-Prasinocladus_malaysianus.AAC.1